MVPSSSTEGHCGKVGVVFVISPILVTDSAEDEHFFALALTDLSPFKIFFHSKNVLVESFRLPPRPPCHGHWFAS